MRVRIIKKPSVQECKDLEGFNVEFLKVGQIYEPGSHLAELLIVCGFAVPEMRATQRQDA